MVDLLCCPFCGSPGAICVLEDEPGSPISFWVSCHCGVETKERRTEEEAVALWNTRAARPQAAEPVGWRWRYRNFPGEMGWIVVSTEPKRHDDVEVQPLYAAPPSQTAAVRITAKMIESASRALCKIDGLDPDEDPNYVNGKIYTEVAYPDEARLWWRYQRRAHAALVAALTDAGDRK